jgi:hypothetical protein
MVQARQQIGRFRQCVFALITTSATVVACLVSAEIVLRFLPVQSGLLSQPVDAENPVFHFTPEREVTSRAAGTLTRSITDGLIMPAGSTTKIIERRMRRRFSP